MIVDLASLDADDLDAVLGDLNADERASVERLLDEFYGKGVAAVSSGDEARCDLARFSPWLVKRLLSDRFEGEMTEDARALLCESAAELYPAAMRKSAPLPLERLAGMFRGRG
jgi:hypothetical protein